MRFVLKEKKVCQKKNQCFRLQTAYSKLDNTENEQGLVGCFGFNGLLRQYFSLYRAVSQREGERKEK